MHFKDFYDGAKFMLFNMPAGNSTILFSVRSKTNGFYPHLSTKILEGDQYQKLDIENITIEDLGKFYVNK